VIVPLSADVRGGIRHPPMFYNAKYGDCVIAWYCNNLLTKNLSSLSTWKKILYRAGFRPPVNATALADYTAYLATVGEKPGPNTGCDPSSFLTWLKAQGKITDWGTVDYTNQSAVQQAMIEHRGVGLTMDLTPYAEGAGEIQMALWDVNAERGNQPDPNAQHMVELVEYNVTNYAIFTWAMTIRLTRAYYDACVNGCYWFT
jgi:hypothetical protein